MPFRALLVTDLDGTFVGFEDATIPESNLAALRRAGDEGVAVAFAPGRRRSQFRRERDRLRGLPFRASLSNGAVLLGEDNERPARVHAIPRSGVRELVRLRAPGIRKLLAVLAPRDEEAS